MSAPDPQGTAYCELTLRGRWAVSLLTEGWTDKEKARLLRGDEEAREAMKDELERRVLAKPDEVLRDHVEFSYGPISRGSS